MIFTDFVQVGFDTISELKTTVWKIRRYHGLIRARQ